MGVDYNTKVETIVSNAESLRKSGELSQEWKILLKNHGKVLAEKSPNHELLGRINQVVGNAQQQAGDLKTDVGYITTECYEGEKNCTVTTDINTAEVYARHEDEVTPSVRFTQLKHLNISSQDVDAFISKNSKIIETKGVHEAIRDDLVRKGILTFSLKNTSKSVIDIGKFSGDHNIAYQSAQKLATWIDSFHNQSSQQYEIPKIGVEVVTHYDRSRNGMQDATIGAAAVGTVKGTYVNNPDEYPQTAENHTANPFNQTQRQLEQINKMNLGQLVNSYLQATTEKALYAQRINTVLKQKGGFINENGELKGFQNKEIDKTTQGLTSKLGDNAILVAAYSAIKIEKQNAAEIIKEKGKSNLQELLVPAVFKGLNQREKIIIMAEKQQPGFSKKAKNENTVLTNMEVSINGTPEQKAAAAERIAKSSQGKAFKDWSNLPENATMMDKIKATAASLRQSPELMLIGIIGSIMFLFGKRNAFTKVALGGTVAALFGEKALDKLGEMGKIWGIDLGETLTGAKNAVTGAATTGAAAVTKAASGETAMKKAKPQELTDYLGGSFQVSDRVNSGLLALGEDNSPGNELYNEGEKIYAMQGYFGKMGSFRKINISDVVGGLSEKQFEDIGFKKKENTMSIDDYKGNPQTLSRAEVNSFVSGLYGMKEYAPKENPTLGGIMSEQSVWGALKGAGNTVVDAAKAATTEGVASGASAALIAKSFLLGGPFSFLAGVGLAGSTYFGYTKEFADWIKVQEPGVIGGKILNSDIIKSLSGELELLVKALDADKKEKILELLKTGKFSDITDTTFPGVTDLDKIIKKGKEIYYETTVSAMDSGDDSVFMKWFKDEATALKNTANDIVLSNGYDTDIKKYTDQITATQKIIEEVGKSGLVDTKIVEYKARLTANIKSIEAKVSEVKKQKIASDLADIASQEKEISDIEQKIENLKKEKNSITGTDAQTVADRARKDADIATLEAKLPMLQGELDKIKGVQNERTKVEFSSKIGEKFQQLTEFITTISESTTAITNGEANVLSLFEAGGALSEDKRHEVAHAANGISTLDHELTAFKAAGGSGGDKTFDSKIDEGSRIISDYLEELGSIGDLLLLQVTAENYSNTLTREQLENALEQYSLIHGRSITTKTGRTESFDSSLVKQIIDALPISGLESLAANTVVGAIAAATGENTYETVKTGYKKFDDAVKAKKIEVIKNALVDANVDEVIELKKAFKGVGGKEVKDLYKEGLKNLAKNTKAGKDAVILAEINKMMPSRDLSQGAIDGLKGKYIVTVYEEISGFSQLSGLKRDIEKRYEIKESDITQSAAADTTGEVRQTLKDSGSAPVENPTINSSNTAVDYKGNSGSAVKKVSEQRTGVPLPMKTSAPNRQRVEKTTEFGDPSFF